MADQDEAGKFAVSLGTQLQTIGADLPPNFPALFRRHAWQLGHEGYLELGTLLVIECLEAKKHSRVLDGDEIRRALDRVRHRLTRQATALRERFEPLRGRQLIDANESGPDKRLIDEEIVKQLLDRLKPREAMILDHWMGGASMELMMSDLNLSKVATRQLLHRALKKAKENVRKFEAD